MGVPSCLPWAWLERGHFPTAMGPHLQNQAPNPRGPAAVGLTGGRAETPGRVPNMCTEGCR